MHSDPAARLDTMPPDNCTARRIGHAALDLADGDREAARQHLALLSGASWPSTARSDGLQGRRSAWPQGSAVQPSAPTALVVARVFVRDGFTCVYCGRWTIPTAILRLISAALPDEFPNRSKWRPDVAPGPYGDIATTVDHIDPVPACGDWQHPDNLATVCARCSQEKASLPRDAPERDMLRDVVPWDGLISLYPALWDRTGRPAEGDHPTWLRAFRSARDPAVR